MAARDVPFPEPLVDAVFVELSPGERPKELRVAPGMASAIGFFDASGRPWPIRQFVIGNADEFKVIQLGEGSLSVSPLERVGWTNLIVALLDEPVPWSFAWSLTAARRISAKRPDTEARAEPAHRRSRARFAAAGCRKPRNDGDRLRP